MRGEVLLAVVVIILLSCMISANGLEVNNLLLKVNSHEDTEVSKTISISSEDGGQVNVNVANVKGVSVSKSDFILDEGGSQNVEVVFNSQGLEPGIYVGNILIKSDSDEKKVPVIFEVESSLVLLDVNIEIPIAYSTVEPGGKLVAQLQIFDLVSGGTSEGIGTTNVDVEYSVFDIDGNEIISETENVVVEDKTQFTKTIVFPDDIREGDYIVGAKVLYLTSVGSSTSTFNIGKKSSDIFSGGGIADVKFFAVLGAIVLFFVGLLAVFVYLIKDRDKMFIELRKYNQKELRKQRELLESQGRVLIKKKKISPVVVKKEIKEKVKALKVKQKERVKEFRKLKKVKSFKKMKEKLKSWKKQGYNTGGLEYKMKGLSAEEMKKILGEWKKEYKH